MAYLDFAHGGNIYDAKRRCGKEIIDFSANINPLGLPPGAKRAVYDNFDRILHYPDPDAKYITQRIAKYWGIDEKNVLLGNGSAELIYLVASTFKPKTSLIPAPTFSEYERAAKSTGSKVRSLKLEENKGFRLDLAGIAESDMFFLCRPNNPTGNLIPEDPKTIERLPAKLLVVDEAFMDFLPDQKEQTVVRKAVKTGRIVALRTFTKFFALPGLRIGYLIAHKKVVRRLKQHQAPWSTNALAQAAAETILNDKAYINKTHKLIDKERRFLLGRLSGIGGLKAYPSTANFLLVKIEKRDVTSHSLKVALIKKGVLVRDCGNFRNLGAKFIRVAVRSRKENSKLLAALKGVA